MKTKDTLGTIIRAGDTSYLGTILEILRATSPKGYSHVPRMSWCMPSRLQFVECPDGTGAIWELDLPDGYTVIRQGARDFVLTGIDGFGRDLRVMIGFIGKTFALMDIRDEPAARNTVSNPVTRRYGAMSKVYC